MQLLLSSLDRVAADWFRFVYHAAWQASLVAVLVLVVVGLGRRWPSPLRYWLLVLALAKFALPPVLSMPTGLFSHVGPAVQPVPSETDVPATAFANSVRIDVLAPLQGAPMMPAPAELGFAAEPSRVVAESPPSLQAPDVEVWLMLLHVTGALVVAFWIVWSLLAMRRMLRRAIEVPDGELRQRFVELSARLGLRHPPRLLLSRDPCGPAAFGVLRPVVVLPRAMASLETSALDTVLAHELAHHRRRDPYVNWIQLMLTAAWWFNPLVWILNRQIRMVREDCCDDLLLTRNLTTNQAYCDTLLNAASKLTGRGMAQLSLGFGDSLHPLGRRFERIMDQTLRRRPRLSLSGGLVLAALAMVVLPGLRGSDAEEPAPTEMQAESKREITAADAVPAQASEWPEGATVTGRVVDHRSEPVANAEVLLLGRERIIVDADRRTWSGRERLIPYPPSTRTDKNGAFSITRKSGTADRLAVIADDPLFWTVSRKSLAGDDDVEIKLPAAGSLAVGCDIPGKPSKLPVMIELRTFDGASEITDSLHFHMSTFSLENPGETLFEHLPPGRYAVQRYQETETGPNSKLLTDADRQLVEIESAKQATVRFERKTGRPLAGRVRGLEDVELRFAIVTIRYLGPEEVLGNDGKRARMYVAFDVIPIDSDGHFTTDPIPPGKYWASLFAVLASTSKSSARTSSDYYGEISFTVPESGDLPKVELVAKAKQLPDPNDKAKSDVSKGQGPKQDERANTSKLGESDPAVTVRPVNAKGESVSLAYLTLWRGLEADEAKPVNRVNDPNGFGFYDPVIWEDPKHNARWIRAGSANPNDGRHGWEEKAFHFRSLKPGRYLVTAVTYRPDSKTPDPTPWGVSEPFSYDATMPVSIDVVLSEGDADLTVRIVEMQTRKPIPGLALRLRTASGVPIVHGHGNGNFIERTGDKGEVRYEHLKPGEFSVQVLGKIAQVNDFVQYEPVEKPVRVAVERGDNSIEITVNPRRLSQAEIDKRFSFSVFGRVSDEAGSPMVGVEVRAATGMGTLLGGGRTRTDSDGKYRLYFGPELRTQVDEDYAPLGVGVQAAHFYAEKTGWTLDAKDGYHFYLMTDQTPRQFEAMLKREGGKVWGKDSAEEVVFAAQPREVNFVLKRSGNAKR